MTGRATRHLTSLLLAGVALACVASLAAAAAPARPASTPSRRAASSKVTKAQPAKSAPAQAGMRAYVDPETGTIGSLPGAFAIAPDGLPGDVALVLTEVPLPLGGYTIDLQGTMQEYSVLKIDARGNRSWTCTKDPRAALKATPVPASAGVTLAYPEK